MIIFEIEENKEHDRTLYWLVCTSITKEDKKHINEIYEQLDSEVIFK